MAATQVIVTPLHEIWTELVAQDGGASQNCDTAIPYNSATDTNFVDTILTLVTVIGNPVFTVTYVELGSPGLLRVTIANTAAGGNSSTWTMDVHLQHTIIR